MDQTKKMEAKIGIALYDLTLEGNPLFTGK